MNMLASSHIRPAYIVIPARDAATFIAEQTKANQQTQKAAELLREAEARADDIVLFASVEADRIAAAARAEVTRMEARVAQEASLQAASSAKQIEMKQKAVEALSAMAQVNAIAEDYASLEDWMTDTIMSAVRQIVGDMAPQDRWIGTIKAALAKTKDRWQLSLSCNFEDYPLVLAAVAEGNFEEAISNVQADSAIPPGVCYLKGNKEHVELNLEAQISAIHEEIGGFFCGSEQISSGFA